MNVNCFEVGRIAHRYGYAANSPLVRINLEGALELHGKTANSRSWGTDENGVWQWDRLLDGYLSEESGASWCDAKAAEQFDAYEN